MHKTENKSLWRDEMSYGNHTWYMGRIYEELKNYACVWLISICISNVFVFGTKLILQVSSMFLVWLHKMWFTLTNV